MVTGYGVYGRFQGDLFFGLGGRVEVRGGDAGGSIHGKTFHEGRDFQ